MGAGVPRHHEPVSTVLEDIEAIRQLKYRYCRALDTRAWDELADCLLPEVTADYAGLAFGRRDELVEYMRSHMTEDMMTLHQAHHPEIAVDGDTATGTWYLTDKVMVPAYQFVLEGAAFYHDEYHRTGDGWRIARTGYERTYEMTWSTESLPGVKLKNRPRH